MAGRGELELDLRLVRVGELSFDEFARKTRDRWRDLAKKLHVTWDLPTWVAPEDLEQEMLIACWKYAWRFRGKKESQKSGCRGIEYFSVWNSLDTSRKVATKARLGVRPHRGDGQGVPSRYEIAVSAMHHDREDGNDDFSVETLVGVDATAERDALRALILRGLVRRARGSDRIVLQALAARRGCVDRATIDLYRDPVLRTQLGLEDAEMGEHEAGKILRKTIRRTALAATARRTALAARVATVSAS